MERYNNYHKHTHISSLLLPDSNAHMIDYINRAIELGHDNVFTTEHACGGDIFEARSLCDSNGLNCKFGLEGYIVENPLENDSRNYHIVLIPKTNVARKKLNKANSRANKEGFYYKPRLFLSDLLNNFDSNELYITTACMAGLLRDDNSINNIFLPLYEKFGKNVLLEVQNHNNETQKQINNLAIKYSKELGLYLIGANDSHYIFPNEKHERIELLKGKGINYSDEDDFILDYPDYDTMVGRFIEQGVLTPTQIENCINNTLIFDSCENINIDKTIKMPTIHKELTDDEKITCLKQTINKEFVNVMEKDCIPKEKYKNYIEEIRKEMKVIENTTEVHTVDYFLLNYTLTKLAKKYGGVLTKTGRGSGGAFLINKILGITEIDRLNVNLPIYSERFMSTARILENHALPDIDFNVAKQEPFIRASKELLGEYGCYPMVAYGTMKESEAFRNVCRSANMPYEEVNEVSKNLDKYRDDIVYGKYIEESQKYIGTIISASVHPCAFILLNGDIEEEIGVMKIGDVLCALITSGEADEWKYLKNDYLIVSVWDIISNVFESIGKPIMSVVELLNSIDDRVWKLFELGMTATLNQVDGNWATSMIKKYKPRTLEELSMFVGAIRPNFESFRRGFINRENYSTGSKELDELFKSTGHFTIFQENLMAYFEWLGVTPAESIGLIKKISKKKIKPNDFASLTDRLRDNWIKNVGNDNQFDEMWNKMQAMMSYGFNAPHGVATALDCLYCAYLKVNYPLEYYTVVLNMYGDNDEKTNRLLKEMRYFNIKLDKPKFRFSKNEYQFNKDTNTIYKGLASIKSMSKKAGSELFMLKDRSYNNFIEFLDDMKQLTTINSKQADILIKLDFFKEFGDINNLLVLKNLYDKFRKSKVLTKSKLSSLEYGCAKSICKKESDKQFRDFDPIELINSIYNSFDSTIPPTTDLDRLRYEIKLLGTTDITIEDEYYCVEDIEQNKYGTTFLKLYNTKSGESNQFKVNKKWWNENNVDVGDLLHCVFEDKDVKRKDENGIWYNTGSKEKVIKLYAKILTNDI